MTIPGGLIGPMMAITQMPIQTFAPTTTAISVAATAHDMNMPATVNFGDLLIINAALMKLSDYTITNPSGWTELVNNVEIAGALRLGHGIFLKKADGTEGGTTVDVVTSATSTGACLVYRVIGWSGTISDIEASTKVTAVSNAPNSSSLSPAGGSATYIWFSLGTAGDDDATVSTYPSSYINTAYVVSGAGIDLGCESFGASIETTAASENPGAYLLSDSEHWTAYTINVPDV